MSALRGQNAGERERLRQEHLRMEALQVREGSSMFIALVAMTHSPTVDCTHSSRGASRGAAKYWEY